MIALQLILISSVAMAADINSVLKSARRMCVNDSVPQALAMLEAEAKEQWTDREKLLLHTEKGDILLYYARLPLEASKVYADLAESKPPKDLAGGIYYRLGRAYERAEKFTDAAKSYEKVVTEYPDSPFNAAALSAIERTFVKNYEVKAAEVDGYPVSQLEVEDIIAKLSPEEQKKASTPEGRKELLERIIYERLLKLAAERQYAPKDSTKVTVHLSCKTCRPKDVMIPGHMSNLALEKRIYESSKSLLLRRLYAIEVTEKLTFTDKEKRRYYKDNIEKFTNPALYTVREIVLDSSGLYLDTIKQALASGMSFDSCAKLYSISQSKSRGGSLGERPAHALPQEIAAVVDTLKPGSPSAPYKTQRGWEITLVESKQASKVNPYEGVEKNVEDLMKRDKIRSLSEDAVARFRKQAGVDSVPNGDTLAQVAGRLILKADLDGYIDDLSQRMPINKEDTAIVKQALLQMITDRVFDHALADAKLFLEDSLSVRNESDRIQLIVNSYLADEVDSKTKPTDEQIAEYYSKHKKDFFQPVKVSVREMLVTSDDTLKIVQKLLSAGAPFDSLARTYSAADSKSRGGYVGFIEEGKSAKPYERQALKLKENAVTRPVKTDEGYWLVKCESRQEARQPTLDDSRYQINSLLANQKKDELEKALKERLMSGAEITITQAGPEPSPTLEITPVPPVNDTENPPEDNN